MVTSILQDVAIFLCLFFTFNKNGASSSQFTPTFWTAPVFEHRHVCENKREARRSGTAYDRNRREQGVADAHAQMMGVVPMFGYDRSLPLDFREYSSIKKNGYAVKDVSYASPHGGEVPSYLVVPNHEDQRFPAVVFLHPGQGNRTTFLSEAEALASRGILSLLISATSVRQVPSSGLTQAQKADLIVKEVIDTKKYIETVVDLQRGIDLLTSFQYVDRNRLVYVGHSLGATWGGVLAGVEDRIKGYVLMAGFSRMSEWHKASEHPLAAFIRGRLSREHFHQFISELESLDALH